MDQHDAQSIFDSLTARELEILRLMAEGLSNDEIAQRLLFTLNTVKWYATQIYGKLGVHRRTQAVAQARASGLIARETATPAAPAPKHNLPIPLIPFVGREVELLELARLLADPGVRLVSIIGPGGVGKTYLSLQAAQRIVDDSLRTTRASSLPQRLFPDGVFFVSLAPLSSSEHIVPAMADAVGIHFQQGRDPKRQVLNYLRGKHMLLIMDNMEHLPDSGEFMAEILQGAAKITLLTTSRIRLNLSMETVFAIGGMDLPGEGAGESALESSAVRLFLECTRRLKPNFDLQDDHLNDIVRICRLVGGMPLGILLAAGWIRMLSPKEIAEEIARNLDFLESPLRDLPERHRSLRSVFRSTWSLLSNRERNTFMKLSVFRGGFTREAAERVAGAGLVELLLLVDKSLLNRTASGRYDVHGLLQQYAHLELAQHPDEVQRVRDAHSACYAEYLAQRHTQLQSDQHTLALREIEGEIENIRAGWRWAAEAGNERDTGSYVETLALFFDIRGWLQEADATFAAIVRALRASLPDARGRLVFGKALARSGAAALTLGKHEEARALFEEGLAIFRDLDDPGELAYVLSGLGNVERLHGRYAAARALYAESLALREALHAELDIAYSLIGMAYLANIEGDFEGARRFCERSLDIRRRCGDLLGMTSSLNLLGSIHYNLGEYEKTRRATAESLSIRRQLGDLWGVARSLVELGDVTRELGDYAEARTYFDEAHHIFDEFGDQRGMEITLVNLGRLSNAVGDFEEGQRLCRQSLDICRELALRWGISFASYHRGLSNWGLGNIDEARRDFAEALKVAAELESTPLIVYVLVGAAKVLIHDSQQTHAAELLTLIHYHPRSNKETRDESRRLLNQLETNMPPDEYQAAWERGKALELAAVVRDLLENV